MFNFLENLVIDELIIIRMNLLSFGDLNKFTKTILYKEINNIIHTKLKNQRETLLYINDLDFYSDIYFQINNIKDNISYTSIILELNDCEYLSYSFNNELKLVTELIEFLEVSTLHKPFYRNSFIEQNRRLEKQIERHENYLEQKNRFIHIDTSIESIIDIFSIYFNKEIPRDFFELLYNELENNNSSDFNKIENIKPFLKNQTTSFYTGIMCILRRMIELKILYNPLIGKKKFRNKLLKHLKIFINEFHIISDERYTDIFERTNYESKSKNFDYTTLDKLIEVKLNKKCNF